MNKLTLCQKIREKCGLSGTGPVTTIGQSGEMLRIVNWFDEAWNDIQDVRDDWFFMRASDSSLATIAASQDATLPESFAHPIALTLTTGTTKNEVEYMEFPAFQEAFRLNTPSTGQPTVWTVDGNTARFNTIADQVYPLTLEYFKQPVVLATDNAIPDIDTRYQMIIVYKAMQLYGLYDNAQETLAEGMRGYRQTLSKMERDQLPEITKPWPMA